MFVYINYSEITLLMKVPAIICTVQYAQSLQILLREKENEDKRSERWLISHSRYKY